MNKDYRIKIKTTHYGAFLILKKKSEIKSRFNFCYTFINNKEYNSQDEGLLKL